MPFVRTLKCFAYKSNDTPLAEVSITFGQDQSIKVVTLTKSQIDQAMLTSEGKIETKQKGKTVTFYFDYHIFPDNSVTVIVADIPPPKNWWEREREL